MGTFGTHPVQVCYLQMRVKQIVQSHRALRTGTGTSDIEKGSVVCILLSSFEITIQNNFGGDLFIVEKVQRQLANIK